MKGDRESVVTMVRGRKRMERNGRGEKKRRENMGGKEEGNKEIGR